MNKEYDRLLDKLHDRSEFYEHLHNLHEKTKFLCEEIFEFGVTDVKLIEVRLSEIYSLLNTAKLFLSIKADLYHYEFSSLLSFCDSTYYQLYAVARDSDSNTSWLYGEFRNFTKQYEIVEQMLKSSIEELKSFLNSKTAD